jgi:hypothetical protein
MLIINAMTRNIVDKFSETERRPPHKAVETQSAAAAPTLCVSSSAPVDTLVTADGKGVYGMARCHGPCRQRYQSTDTPLSLIGPAHFLIWLATKRCR